MNDRDLVGGNLPPTRGPQAPLLFGALIVEITEIHEVVDGRHETWLGIAPTGTRP